MKSFSLWTLVLAFSLIALGTYARKNQPAILVFSLTKGFRHSSITEGKAMFLDFAIQQKMKVDTTEDASVFTPEKLKGYKMVVFLNTTGDVLNENQQAAFQAYIRGGGSFLGIHAATDTEYEWPWYNKLVGAYFKGHPKPQHLNYIVTDAKHPAVSFWAPQVKRFEEVYNFKSLQKDLLTFALMADEKSYEGGDMGDFHPAAWYHVFDGGKVFYTALGHHPETYADPDFRKHILGAMEWLLK